MHALLRSSFWRALPRRHPSAFLLAAQLLSLLLYPLMDQSSEGRLLFGGVAVVVVPLAVWVVSRSPSINTIAWLLAGPSLLMTIWVVVMDDTALLPIAAGLEALLYFYAAAGLIAYMMHDVRVTADELFAAGATFTLLAWGFAYTYFVCQSWYPDSFTGLEPERERTWLELLSYSFSNLSAVGLGDTLPVGAPARVLTMLEQFAGVGYIAVVVSRLIALTVMDARQR
jgi:hypothetical protein